MMTPHTSRRLIALCGILGTMLLTLYFAVGALAGLAQLPPDTTQAAVVTVATHHHALWLLGTWMQATGSLLSVVFMIALVQLAGRSSTLAGMLTALGAAVLLAVVLIEGVFTLDLAQAASDGHPATALTSFDVMTVFTHIYPLAPAPLIYGGLGAVLWNASVLPRLFAYLALALCVLFAISGLVGLFTLPVITLIPLVLQGLWLLAAALTLVAASPRTARPVRSMDEAATASRHS